jgi:hypothetical protein
MSKELWFEAYESELNELGDDPEAEDKAIEYAEDYFERICDFDDNIRKAKRENEA